MVLARAADDLTDDVLHPAMAGAEKLVECDTCIRRQMETIGDLDGVGCALLSTLCAHSPRSEA